MKEKKTFPGREIRNTWTMNPVTRVHDNDPAKNKKKERQNARKTVDKEINAFLHERRHDRKRWTDNDSDQRFFVGFTVSSHKARNPDPRWLFYRLSQIQDFRITDRVSPGASRYPTLDTELLFSCIPQPWNLLQLSLPRNLQRISRKFQKSFR